MAKLPANSPPQATSLGDFTPGKGFTQVPTITAYQLAPYPVPNPPFLLAMDCVPFQTGNDVITFLNIPVRNNVANPLNPTKTGATPLTIRPQDCLMFIAVVQGSSVPVEVTTQVIDNNNIIYPGPFLSAGTYLTFQAKLSAGSPTSGIVVGQLFLQRG
jgi:hypothetical protein